MKIQSRSLLLAWCIALVCLHGRAYEYIYPVGCHTYDDGHTTVFCVYQRDLSSLTILAWDPDTQCAHAVCASRYTPAGFRLLPHGFGFSFIDNDRLRIQQFQKRSAHSCEFEQPLTHLSPVVWSDSGLGYFCARLHGRYELLQLLSTGECALFLSDPENDYVYPQVVGQSLFYIQRRKDSYGNQTHSTLCIAASKKCIPPQHAQSLDEMIADLIDRNESDGVSLVSPAPASSISLLSFGTRSIIHLTMISDSFGLVIEPTMHQVHDPYASFICHAIYKQSDETWSLEQLFSWKVPVEYITGTRHERFYESLLPLLPRCIRGNIYFVDSHGPQNLTLYTYDLQTGACQQCMPDGAFFFCPLQVGSLIICGTLLHHASWKVTTHTFLEGWPGDGGQLKVDLPIINFN